MVPPSAKQLFIGLTVSLVAVIAIGAAWFLTIEKNDNLASRLPADAVLAYAEFPAESLGTDLTPIFSRFAPALPAIPAIDASVTAVAAVRTHDGIEGWITYARSGDGTTRIRATHPALESLMNASAPSLSSDRTFHTLRPDDERGWVYLAYPRLSAGGSPFAALLALDTPIVVRDGNGLTLRLPLQPAPRIAPWQQRPMASLQNPTLVAPLPSWHAMERLGTLLTDDARTIAETVARTFAEGIANGLSLQHDISLLLDGPSLLQVADAGEERVFSLEGEGRSSGDVDRVLRTTHQRFASARGTGKARTVTMEGFALETLTQEQESVTTQRRDGEWLILETRIGASALASAQNGRRFVLTTAPDALFAAQDETGSRTGGFAWSPEAAARLEPLWPTLQPRNNALEWRLSDGPGYVEWTIQAREF